MEIPIKRRNLNKVDEDETIIKKPVKVAKKDEGATHKRNEVEKKDVKPKKMVESEKKDVKPEKMVESEKKKDEVVLYQSSTS